MKAIFVQQLRMAGWTLLGAWLFLFSSSMPAAAESIVTPAMVGHWSGNARIIVTWCRQTNLPVALDIRADGSVTGKVGDAVLVNGQLKKNRG